MKKAATLRCNLKNQAKKKRPKSLQIHEFSFRALVYELLDTSLSIINLQLEET